MFERTVGAMLVALTLGASAASAVAGDLKVAYFNFERILTSSLSAQVASERLNEEAKRRQTEVDQVTQRFKQRYEAFQKNAATMSDMERLNEQRQLAEMERDVTRRATETRDEMNQRRNEEVMLLQNRAAQVVKKLAQDEKYDLVLSDAFFASDRVDITERVIKLLDKGLPNK